MTLKEKLKKQLDTATPTLNRPNYQASKLEQIADEFAIGFAEWLVSRAVGENGLKLKDDVLETYKKEKGL